MSKKPPKAKVYKFASLEDADTSNMSFEELQNFCLQVFQEIETEKQEVEKYELERDKLVVYWNYTGDRLRDKLYDQRDQEVCLENDEFAMESSVNRKIQESRRNKADSSEAIENLLVSRGANIVKQHEMILEKTYQIWTDVQEIRSKIFDVENLKSEAMTDQKYVEQKNVEVITTNIIKQRKLDMKRVKKELAMEIRNNYLNKNSERFREECWLKRGIMNSVIKNNNCSLKKLVSTFDRILNYNFEKVSVLKEKAENLKTLDVMLSKEYSEANKQFYNAIASLAQSMRTLNQMRIFLYAAPKSEKSLALKKKELQWNEVEAECLSIKTLNSEMKIKQLEKKLEELTEQVISYRRITTEMIREDEEILSRNIEKLLLELYDQKVRFHTTLAPYTNVDMKHDAADIGKLTYRTENIGDIHSNLHQFRTASTVVVTLFKRLFKIWEIEFHDFEVIHKKPENIAMKCLPHCENVNHFSKW